jgi:ADP-ribose pyrophosphatase
MSRQVLYQGKKIQLVVERHELPDGVTVQREVVLHPGAVVILPLLADGRVCLIRNRRAAVGETLLELPAGTLQPPEEPAAAAARELAEETGYRAGRWRKLAEFYPSPGVLSERMYLFLAEELTPGPLALDPGEEVQPQLVAWPDALARALDGTIRDGKTLVGLLLWDRLRDPGKE